MAIHYQHALEGRFVKRLNRFLCEVTVDGHRVTAHVPNTSRLTELQTPGNPVIVVPAEGKARKTRYTLIHMMKQGVWLNIDSRAPNRLVLDALEAAPERIGLESAGPLLWRREYPYDHSRFDGAYAMPGLSPGEPPRLAGLVEVKGVTLETGGIARFPGAPTTRGQRHLTELAAAAKTGLGAHVVYCIQIPYAEGLVPAREIDPAFGRAYDAAKAAGVTMHAFRCRVTPDTVTLAERVPCE